MIYTEMTCKAARIAYKAHEGAVDKCGMPYIFHPLHLAEQMTDEDSTIAALLHDVVEDTDITLDDLRREGFSQRALEAIDLLTYREGVDYLEYVAAIKANSVAKAVKLADLAHNMDETRYNGAESRPTAERLERMRKKYSGALAVLTEQE